MLKSFLHNKKGNIALTSAILALPLIAAGGAAVDYTLEVNARNDLQHAADAAALASVKELALTSTQDESITSIAKNYVLASLAETTGHNPDPNDVLVTTEISPSRKDVTVNIAFTWEPLLLHYVDETALPIRVAATGSLAGDQSVCVIALDTLSSSSLAMTGTSSLQANDCAIYSNSSNSSGIEIVSGASMQSATTYTSGGFSGPLSGYSPKPVTDSPSVADPLADRAPPSYGSCEPDKQNLKFTNGNVTLYPGVYCGGITTKGKVTVNLKPGEYIIKDGPLSIGGNSTLQGDNVGFYFDGATSVYDFGVSTQINLTAPKTGALSGILFFEAHDSVPGRNFTIRSKDAERFEGTVYLPKGRFVIDKASRVGQLSNWTAIIARQIEIMHGPSLQINADYGASTIPVPDGIGPTGTPRLTR